jgi:multidrug resistance efflux pump
MRFPRGFRWLLGSAAVVAVVVTGAGAWRGVPRAGWGEAPAVEAEPEPVLCYGYVDVEPGVTRLVPARPGEVAAVLVGDNQAVEAGQVLLRLDDRPARLQVQQARAELADARDRLEEARRLPRHQRARLAGQQAALEAARHRRDAARHRQERLERLAAKELCGPDEVLAAAEELRALEAAVRAEEERRKDLEGIDPLLAGSQAQALVDARTAQLGQAEHTLRQCVLTAPERGTVLRVHVNPGEVLPGSRARPAICFCPDRPRIIRAEVSQEWAARVAPGQAALLQDNGDPAQHWHGTVKSISDWYTPRRPVLDDPLELQDVRTVECLIEPESAARLRLGQKLRVTITPGP